MEQLLTYTILGLSTAAIYSVAASGLVLTYTTTGIFNFAHGAAGMLGAFAYWQLRVGWGWPAPAALALVLLVLAPLFGAGVERVLMRGLQGTSETTKLVVSISLLVALVGVANWIWEPGVARPTRRFFAGQKVDLGPVFVTWHEITTIVVAIVVAIGLRALLRRARIGIAMRAAVDDRELAMLNGARPDRAGMFAWAIGSSLAATAGILIAPALALEATTLSLLIVNAYAAAMIGRLRSLPLTFAGAVVLGLADAYVTGYLPTDNRYLSGFRAAIPAILLFVALLALPNLRLGTRPTHRREWFPKPRASSALVAGAILVAGTVAVSGMLDRADSVTGAKLFALAIIALSLVPLVGFAGEISLCQMTFAGIGAVAMAHLGTDGNPVGLLWAVVLAAGVGMLVALPALRLRGIHLALATAAFAVAFERWVFPLPRFEVLGRPVAFFEEGSLTVDRLRVGGISFESERAQLILLATTFAVLATVVVALRRSRFGQRLLAVHDSPAACATLGLDLTRTRLAVFALSASIAGLGGALYAGLLVSVNPSNFGFFESLPLLMMTVVGGIGAAGGALFAGVTLAAFPVLAAEVPALENVVLVLPGVIGISLGRHPEGVVSLVAARFAPVAGSRPVVAGLALGLPVLYLARTGDLLTNWSFVVVAGAMVLLSPTAAELLSHRPAETTTAGEHAAAEAPTDDGAGAVPLEWVGIERPFTPDDVRAVDRALGVKEAYLHGHA